MSHKNHLGDVSGLHSVGEAARHGGAGVEQAGGRGLGRRDGRGDGQEGGQRGGLGLGLGVVSGCAEVALPLQGKLQSLPLVSLSDLSTATQAQQANTHKRTIKQKAGHFYDNLSKIMLEVYSKGKSGLRIVPLKLSQQGPTRQSRRGGHVIGLHLWPTSVTGWKTT